MGKQKYTLLILLPILLPLLALRGNAQEVIELTPDDFAQKVYNFRTEGPWKYLGDKPAIIDCFTPWCVHCKTLMPRLQRLAKAYAGQIIVYSINGEKAPNLMRQLGIQAYPSLLFIPMSEIPTLSMGALSEEDLIKGVESILLKKENK